MSASEISLLIKTLKPPFLDDIDPPAKSAIVAAARVRRFLAKSIITNQGHPASHLYLVLDGSATSFFLTQGGHKLHIYSFPPGEMFGGMALIARKSDYVVSTEAVKDSQMLIWEREVIRRLAEEFPKLRDNALTIAAEYLNASIAMQVALTCHTARQRLAEVLVNLASGVGHRVSDGIELAVRNEELASAASLTPFTVSRLMSEWQRSGLVTKTRGKVLLPSPERLLLQDL
jgi:CRP/FNR family transcriptional regulator, nitrogen oxide reductase regulator